MALLQATEFCETRIECNVVRCDAMRSDAMRQCVEELMQGMYVVL